MAAIAADGVTPSLLELLDQTHLRAIEAYRPMGLPTDAKALLLAAADTGTRAAADLARIADVCEAAGATEVYAASDATEAAELFAARRLAHPAMERFAAEAYPGGNGGLIIDDVAVPRGRLAELLDGIERIAADVRRAGRRGRPRRRRQHAPEHRRGPGRPGQRRARPGGVRRDHGARASSLGGTCTGEHGVGLLKREWLAPEIGPVGMRVHQAIKQALDPPHMLNPAKILPTPSRVTPSRVTPSRVTPSRVTPSRVDHEVGG